MGLFEELKRRNVIRVGAAYLLFAWVVIQVTDTVAPVLNLPDWTLAFVTWFGIIGFPFVLFFAWAFELTPDGLKREEDVDRSESITNRTGHKINIVVIGLLVIAVVFLVTDNYVLDDTHEANQAADETPSETTDSAEGYDSIGVLPFVNMSDDPSQDYFSDGISEELLNALAKLKDLQVAARTSSFAFKNQNQDITSIGKQLNVDTILEGSVRKAGTRLRITAQLIDVSNGFHLWSETYDRELTDVFAIQDEITAAIVEALLLHFNTGETQDTIKVEATNMSAYDAYLQGRHQLRNASIETLREALTNFRAATDADPNFAPAWAARAVAVIMLRETDFREGIPREEAHLLARNSIDRALAIDPMLADAYIAESLMLADDYRYEDALRSLEKAVEINPNLAEAWTWRSRILGRFGRVKEARENMLKALELDPHNPVTAAIAANLATDFYEPEFYARVKRNVAQFTRARQILEEYRWTEVEPPTKEAYQQAAVIPNMRATWIAALNFGMLKEIDEAGLSQGTRRPGEFLMWIYMGTDQWDKAQAMYDELSPGRQQSALNLEELSIMQTNQGRYEEALASLDAAHGNEIRIHGMVPPTSERSNSNLALNRVYCLRQLGRDTEAEAILERVRLYVETLRENSVYGIYSTDARLRVLDGDIDGALDVLEAASQRNELFWANRYSAIIRTLSDEPRFQALFGQIDQQVDALRAELGMPPATF